MVQHLWLLVAGPPCQNLSAANKSTGARGGDSGVLGQKSRLVFAVVDILAELQRQVKKQRAGSVVWLIENVASMEAGQRQIFSHFFAASPPVTLYGGDFRPMDRARHFWTNLPVRIFSQTPSAAAAKRRCRTVVGPG